MNVQHTNSLSQNTHTRLTHLSYINVLSLCLSHTHTHTQIHIMYRYTHVYLHTHMQTENKRDRWHGGGGVEKGEKRGAARQTKACERTNRRKQQQKSKKRDFSEFKSLVKSRDDTDAGQRTPHLMFLT